MADPPLTRHDVVLVRAANPGPFTLTGTNTWLIGRDPCWVVDPGPALAAHVDAVLAQARLRGGVGGIALTHDHGDHAGAAELLRARGGSPPVAAARWEGVEQPDATLDGYLRHRLERERRLVAALAAGLRGVDELLDRVWDDAAPSLRAAATATLAAHLDKLDEEGLLPAGVQWPAWPPPGGQAPVV